MSNGRTIPNRDAEVMEALRDRLEETRDERSVKVADIIDRLEDAHPATLVAAEIVIRQALAGSESNPFEWFKVPPFGHPRPSEILPGILNAYYADSDNSIREALIATGEFYRYKDFNDAADALDIPERTNYARPPRGLQAMNRVLLWQSSRFADDEWRGEFMTPNGTAIRSSIQTEWFLIYAELLSEYVDVMAENMDCKNNSVAIAAMVNGREALARRFLA